MHLDPKSKQLVGKVKTPDFYKSREKTRERALDSAKRKKDKHALDAKILVARHATEGEKEHIYS